MFSAIALFTILLSVVALAMVLPSAMAMVIAIAITVTMAMDIVLPDPIDVIIVNRPGVAGAVLQTPLLLKY